MRLLAKCQSSAWPEQSIHLKQQEPQHFWCPFLAFALAMDWCSAPFLLARLPLTLIGLSLKVCSEADDVTSPSVPLP